MPRDQDDLSPQPAIWQGGGSAAPDGQRRSVGGDGEPPPGRRARPSRQLPLSAGTTLPKDPARVV